jgi:hypothetical protein
LREGKGSSTMPLDAGQLSGAVGSSRDKAEGREREREITRGRWNENAAEGCLPLKEAFSGFLYLNKHLVDTKRG